MSPLRQVASHAHTQVHLSHTRVSAVDSAQAGEKVRTKPFQANAGSGSERFKLIQQKSIMHAPYLRYMKHKKSF